MERILLHRNLAIFKGTSSCSIRRFGVQRRPLQLRSSRTCCPQTTNSSCWQSKLIETSGRRALGVLATLAVAFSSPSYAAHMPSIAADKPLLDLAKVVPSGRVDNLTSSLRSLESESGWRVRVLTKYDKDIGPSKDDIRAAWKPDKRTVFVIVDTSAPNIFYFNYGDQVLTQLRRPFFTELQSRYGNLFYIRENGESAAVLNAVDTLVLCLAKDGGCPVVPGLPADQYYLTLATSIAGGLVFGFASQLQPQGIVQRKWVWLLLFFPLWGTLFVNFGIGPIVTRTADPLPILGNVAGFATTVALVKLSPMFAVRAGLKDKPDK